MRHRNVRKRTFKLGITVASQTESNAMSSEVSTFGGVNTALEIDKIQELSLPVRLGSSSKRALSPQQTLPTKRCKVEDEDEGTVTSLLGPSQASPFGERAAPLIPSVLNENGSAPEPSHQRPVPPEPISEPVEGRRISVSRHQEGSVCSFLS